MAVVTPVFLDTSVLLPGLIECGGEGAAAQQVLAALAEGRIRNAHTAWHCCLEFLAVATRLPAELRLRTADAVALLEAEVLARMQVHQLPEGSRKAFLRASAEGQVAGGRFYDAHIAEIARLSGARVVVTGNRRHFGALPSQGIRVVTAGEYAAELAAR